MGCCTSGRCLRLSRMLRRLSSWGSKYRFITKKTCSLLYINVMGATRCTLAIHFCVYCDIYHVAINTRSRATYRIPSSQTPPHTVRGSCLQTTVSACASGMSARHGAAVRGGWSIPFEYCNLPASCRLRAACLQKSAAADRGGCLPCLEFYSLSCRLYLTTRLLVLSSFPSMFFCAKAHVNAQNRQ